MSLRTGRNLADSVLEQAAFGCLAFDDNLHLLFCNRRGRDLLGIKNPCTGSPLLSASLPEADRNLVLERCRNTVHRSGAPSSPLTLSGGRTLAWQTQRLEDFGWIATMEPPSDGSGQLDPLTGLQNRAALTQRLDTAADPGTAILLIDLDRFKAVNDNFGHPTGDLLLQRVARRLGARLRSNDLVYRLAGDEFAIVLGDGSSAIDAATRMIDLISRPYLVDGQIATIGASIGIASAPQDGNNAETLLRSADMALYHAKAVGRGVAQSYHPEMAEEAAERHALETDLRLALVQRELELHYQPQIDLAAKRLAGFEALLRWSHPTRGLISPGHFVPLAERTRLIEPIGEWALRTACIEAQRWPTPVSVAVNVSAVQLADPGRLQQAVEVALEQSGLPPPRLELEITESALIREPESAIRCLHALRKIGVQIALDDFGTGYSSLGQLRSFPFDKLKIDRSFVSGLGSSTESIAVVRAIAALGASLGMRTTAEGVETDEQAAHVLSEGCTQMQGYLVSRPVPASDISALIERLTLSPERGSHHG